MDILIYIAIFITIVYNCYMIIRYKKIPESLSETSYLLGGNKRYWFTGYCFIICILLLPVLFEITVDSLLFLPFLICGGLSFAGCSPLFREGLDKPVHYIFSILAFVCYICYMIFCMGWTWLIGYLVLLLILCFIKKTSTIYWAEMLAIIEICIFALCF